LPLLHLHLKIGRKEIGKKEHDWSDDGSDPMSQASVVQNKIGRKKRYLL
jgi:hypothetical protein